MKTALKFVGGYTYRFKYADGSHADYVFAGSNGVQTIWQAKDGSVHHEEVFRGIDEVEEVHRPDKAINEVR